jgi:hypothetical protein
MSIYTHAHLTPTYKKIPVPPVPLKILTGENPKKWNQQEGTMKNDVMQQEKRSMKPVINYPIDPETFFKKTIRYPCELRKPISIDGTLCKFILDYIDGEVYGTNSFAFYHLYDQIFFEQKPEEHTPRENNFFDCHTFATPEAFKQALEQEKQRYADGYRYITRWVKIRGDMWKEGRWVKQGDDAK